MTNQTSPQSRRITTPGARASPLVQIALARLHTILEEFTGTEEGVTSRSIGCNAERLLHELHGMIDGNGAGEVSCFDLAALLDGARAVPDASATGFIALTVGRRIADALGDVIHYTTEPGAAEIAELEAALEAPSDVPVSRDTGAANGDVSQCIRRAMAFLSMLDDMMDVQSDSGERANSPHGRTQGMYACMEGLRRELLSIERIVIPG